MINVKSSPEVTYGTQRALFKFKPVTAERELCSGHGVQLNEDARSSLFQSKAGNTSK
jgi:hypothetical protein